MKKSFVLVDCQSQDSLKKVISTLKECNYIVLDFWRTRENFWKLKIIRQNKKGK